MIVSAQVRSCRNFMVLIIAFAILLFIIYICFVWTDNNGSFKKERQPKRCMGRKHSFSQRLNSLNKDVFEYAKLMEKRGKFIRSQCNSTQVPFIKYPSLFVSNDLKLIHCGFHNTGAEKLFRSLEQDRRVPPLSANPAAANEWDLCRFTKALYVQHPIENFLKLYRDKTLLHYYFGHSKHSFDQSFTRYNFSVLFPTFSSFLKHVANLTLASFFVGSISAQCQLCDIDYDVIILPDSRINDLKLLFEMLNLPFNEEILANQQIFRPKYEKSITTDPSLKNALKKVELFYESDFRFFNLTLFH